MCKPKPIWKPSEAVAYELLEDGSFAWRGECIHIDEVPTYILHEAIKDLVKDRLAVINQW